MVREQEWKDRDKSNPILEALRYHEDFDQGGVVERREDIMTLYF